MGVGGNRHSFDSNKHHSLLSERGRVAISSSRSQKGGFELVGLDAGAETEIIINRHNVMQDAVNVSERVASFFFCYYGHRRSNGQIVSTILIGELIPELV